MAWSLTGYDNSAANRCEFTCDTAADIDTLPTHTKQVDGRICSPGSTAFVVDSSTVYMLNNKDEWCQI